MRERGELGFKVGLPVIELNRPFTTPIQDDNFVRLEGEVRHI